ncbi:hypothetical protein CBZ_29200 [Cellulomonas biazotea]|uniref:Uncharacterized protein n=1 Tax=Cellulomonas biazotea TaxID=1709 RepID=A0A402DUR5_9CELL|nr:hypothetical protein CBZ_29200 [Cellulomonas biazotea]
MSRSTHPPTGAAVPPAHALGAHAPGTPPVALSAPRAAAGHTPLTLAPAADLPTLDATTPTSLDPAGPALLTSGPGALATLPVVQRRTEPVVAPQPPAPPDVPTAPVQRAEDGAPIASAPPVALDAASGTAAAGASASMFAAASPADLDELARKLMPPLMRRVRGQLLVDRERRGIRTDR